MLVRSASVAAVRWFQQRWAKAEPLCNVCRRGLYDFDFARSSASYTPKVARAIVLLKYEELVPLGRWFAMRLLEVAHAYAKQCAADVVVPVPLHPARLRERGYNQAELIARPLARELRLPCRSYLLVPTRPRPDKLTLTFTRTLAVGTWCLRHPPGRAS